MLSLVKNSFFGRRKTLLPFQKGIIIGIEATKQLYDDLKARLPLRYLLTARLNQDLVENLFSRIRALGLTFNHPGPVACKNRIRVLTIVKEADIIVRTASVSACDVESMPSQQFQSNSQFSENLLKDSLEDISLTTQQVCLGNKILTEQRMPVMQSI